MSLYLLLTQNFYHRVELSCSWSTSPIPVSQTTKYQTYKTHRNAKAKCVLKDWACADVEKEHKHTHTHSFEWTFLPLLKSHARSGLIIPAAGTWDFSFFPLKSNMNYLALCWSRWVSAPRFPPQFHYFFSVCAWTVYVVIITSQHYKIYGLLTANAGLLLAFLHHRMSSYNRTA